MKIDGNKLPSFLKTIYVLIADDKLGADENAKFLQRFSGLIRGLAIYENELEGWTIEVRGVDDPRVVLKHIQVRPVDLILLDCDFSRYKKDTQKENNSDEIINIDNYIFNEKIKNIGIDLYRHLNNARHFKIEDKDCSLDFTHVLFTDYKDEIKQYLTDRKWTNEVYDINKKDVSIFDESLFYLLNKNTNNTADKLVELLVGCKNRILNWIDIDNGAKADVQYRVLHRFIGHKFAHHDWLPEYLMCIPNGQKKNAGSRADHLFSIPGWEVYSRGREYKKPTVGGLFFAFPQNKKVENLTPANTYEGKSITKAATAFIDYLNQYKPDENSNKTIIHSGIYKPNEIFNKEDTYKIAAAKIEANNGEPQNEFGGIKFGSRLWLAATPLTGSTMAGESEMVIKHFIGKIEALLSLGIGAAVLKTVYPSGESNGEWPEQDMFLKNQSRCYKKINTLYNTGSTPNEAFPPKMFNKVLTSIMNNDSLCKKIIPSLGAHTNDEKTWNNLFSDVFETCSDKYPLVEINARHAIREIAVSSGLRGDEYFHPMSADISATLARLTAFYTEFERWVRTVAKIAKIAGNRKLIFKFPYRLDLFVFLNICNVLKQEFKNICGVTLINTFKSPLIHPQTYPKRSAQPAGADPKKDFKGFFDLINHPQVSGATLAPIRNYILDALQDNRFIPDGFNLDVSASGGINEKEDIIECLTLGAKSVQLGTNLLVKTTEKSVHVLNGAEVNENIYKKNREIAFRIPKIERFVKRRIKFDIGKCKRCGSCYKSYYCDAFLNRRFLDNPIEYGGVFYDLAFPLIDEDACVGCGLCEQLCEWGALSLDIKDDNPAGGFRIDKDENIISYFDKTGNKRTVPDRRIILASSSSRRHKILNDLGIRFEIQEPEFEEINIGDSPEAVVNQNALGKASEIAEKNTDAIVIGCDTVIALDGQIIGKPEDAAKAKDTLLKLSDKTHSVFSGLAVVNKEMEISCVKAEETKINFHKLSEKEIDDYIATGEPFDKAGAYGIQGRGELFVERIEGSFSNVVGLPKKLLLELLSEVGLEI